jgi:hypothetical protein
MTERHLREFGWEKIGFDLNGESVPKGERHISGGRSPAVFETISGRLRLNDICQRGNLLIARFLRRNTEKEHPRFSRYVA